MSGTCVKAASLAQGRAFNIPRIVRFRKHDISLDSNDNSNRHAKPDYWSQIVRPPFFTLLCLYASLKSAATSITVFLFQRAFFFSSLISAHDHRALLLFLFLPRFLRFFAQVQMQSTNATRRLVQLVWTFGRELGDKFLPRAH